MNPTESSRPSAAQKTSSRRQSQPPIRDKDSAAILQDCAQTTFLKTKEDSVAILRKSNTMFLEGAPPKRYSSAEKKVGFKKPPPIVVSSGESSASGAAAAADAVAPKLVKGVPIHFTAPKAVMASGAAAEEEKFKAHDTPPSARQTGQGYRPFDSLALWGSDAAAEAADAADDSPITPPPSFYPLQTSDIARPSFPKKKQ